MRYISPLLMTLLFGLLGACACPEQKEKPAPTPETQAKADDWVPPSSIEEARIKGDGILLAKVVKSLRERLQVQEDRRRIENSYELATSREFLFSLFLKERLSLESMKHLAGVSGDALSEDELYYEGTPEDLDTYNLIFTTANDGKTLSELLRSNDPAKDGVIFCYNVAWMHRYQHKLLIVGFAGETEFKPITLKDLEAKIERISGKKIQLVGKKASEIFGKYPFHNIAPE